MQSVFIFYIFSYEPVTYGTDYNYPKWAEYMGLCMSFASMVWVPLYAVYYVLTQPGTFKEVWFFFLNSDYLFLYSLHLWQEFWRAHDIQKPILNPRSLIFFRKICCLFSYASNRVLFDNQNKERNDEITVHLYRKLKTNR